MYELASCLKGAAGSQICQSGAAMPDRLAPLLATNRLASATVIIFSLEALPYGGPRTNVTIRIGTLEPVSVLPTGICEPGNRKFRSAGTCKKYWCTICSGSASDKKIMKNMTYRVLDSGFTMHA